jgi:hypothetical protein
MRDFIAKILISIIGARHLKKIIVTDRLQVEMNNILTDNKWHHIAITTSAWIRRKGKKKFNIDDVAVFKDGKKTKDVVAIYKLSNNHV